MSSIESSFQDEQKKEAEKEAAKKAPMSIKKWVIAILTFILSFLKGKKS